MSYITKQRLQKEFTVPPFSILDTRKKHWQNRKDYWINLGIRSEIGRSDDLLGSSLKNLVNNRLKYSNRKSADMISNIKNSSKQPKWASNGMINMSPGTSVFDGALCETIYKWFCCKNDKILDPFAGGSIRGIIAEKLGYHYTGIELRKGQIDANIEQAKNIGVNPTWINGDSINVSTLIDDKYDFLFSCPPYYNLEVYSDLPGELSFKKTYEEFLLTYKDIILKCVSKLYDNIFACFVVSEIRDKNGFYYGFVKDTINAFINAGMKYYNEIILINEEGTLPIRVKRTFIPTRKIGKQHQNVLIFYKGDVKKIRPIKLNYKLENIDKWL